MRRIRSGGAIVVVLLFGVSAGGAKAQNVQLDFSTPVAGTLMDVNGNGTGFTHRLPGTGAALPANDPNLLLGNGRLRMTSTTGELNSWFNLGIAEVPSVQLPPLGGTLIATTRIVTPALPVGSDQAGIVVGNAHTGTLRLIVHSGRSVILVGNHGVGGDIPYNGIVSGQYAPGASIDLALVLRPDGRWEGLWYETNGGGTISTGAFSVPWIDTSAPLYVGLHTARGNQTIGGSFSVDFEHFSVASPLPAVQAVGPGSPLAFSWPTSQGGNGHVYEFVVKDSPVDASGRLIDFATANAAALAAGGSLATITSPAESSFLFGILSSLSSVSPFGCWIGGMQPIGSPEPSGGWRWITGEAFAWTDWGPGQPDPGPENRMIFGHFGLPQWHDCLGTRYAAGFIVEYDPNLPCAPANGNAFTMRIPHNASGDVGIQLSNLPASTRWGRTLFSRFPASPVGSGPIAGLHYDPAIFMVSFLPLAPRDPLAWSLSEPGFFPEAPYFFPPGIMLPLAGTTWDLMAIAQDAQGAIHFSTIEQVTW